ncbi:MAG: hypothetical protein JEZ14_19425 [Marinilabiliaceae bacterium]|nr:hypothetical protein [Marinilabiliaceae bacterium]
MKINQQAERLKYLVNIIKCGKTGNANTLAKRVGISRTSLFELFDDFRALGLEVYYNRSSKSYCLGEDNTIEVVVPVKVMKRKELTEIEGGFHQKSLSVHFSERCSTYL